MTKSKTTKRALLSSCVALMLCFSMLLGTTYAWFTDSVTSKNNIITAGNLDVELYYQVEGQTDWTKVTADTNIFKENTLWEPGHTEVVKLKVVNEGTLALKYQLSVNVASETGSVNVAGKDFNLSDYIKFGIVDGAQTYSRDEAVAAVDATATALKEAYNSGTKSLLAKNDTDSDENIVTMVVYMPTTVGNEANYRGNAVPTINLGLNLLATQVEAEFDSFDNDYDADATYGTYIELNEGDDLLAAMAAAEAGLPLTIKLNGDVEWPTEGHHGENDITPASSIVIDGNGNTITATGSGVTPLGDNDAPMTLKNVKIVDNSVSYNETAWEFSYLEMGGRVLNCVNVDFVDPISVDSDAATFTNCTFVGHYDKNITSTTQYGVWVANGDATFTKCTFTGTRGMKICDQYAPEVGKVVVDGCTFNGLSEKPGVVIDNRGEGDVSSMDGMTVIIKNSTFINCQPGDQSCYIYETDNVVPESENNTVLNNATVVSTKADLLALSAKTLTGNNGTAEEATIVIGADIDMQGAEFSAIIAQRGDKLTIVGNGHKISNVEVVSGENDNTTGQASMFYAYPNSTLTVSDLTLENITVTADENGSGYAAAVVGYCEGAAVLNNVDVVKATVTGVKSSGMLVGHLSGTLEAKDCELSGTVTLADFAEEANGHYAGKYIGTLAGPATLTDCEANVTVSGNLNAANSGAIYGRMTDAGNIEIDGATVVASVDQLAAAVGEGKTNIFLAAGTYKLPAEVKSKTVTISGTADTKIDVSNGLTYINGSNVTFDGVTIQSKPDGEGYKNGLADATYTIFNNCVINGTLGLDYSCEFNNCKFNIEGNYYNIWTWGAGTATFNGCTFNCDGKAMLVYANVLDNNTNHQTVNITDCVFNDNGDDTVTGKAAIEITNTYNNPIRTYDVFIKNTTVNGFAQTVPGSGDFNAAYGSVEGSDIGTNVWGNKCKLPNTQINVVIDSVDAY